MGELVTMLTKLLTVEAAGWGIVIALVTSLFWIAGLGVKNRGQLDVAKEEASVSLNEQGKQLVLQMVETLKEEVSQLKEANAAMVECTQHNERMCDLLIAILSAPDQAMLDYEMDRAKAYLVKIGKWKEPDDPQD